MGVTDDDDRYLAVWDELLKTIPGSYDHINRVADLAETLGVAENYGGTVPMFTSVGFVHKGEYILPLKHFKRRTRVRFWFADWKYRLSHAWDALKGKECGYDD